ncbi:metallophosphoesterase family protein [Sorangium sp. So ce1389]|uniref:metallophosphoesterase family protein n=1 Tax=Sorangium sp. So ce1389 TaxID=3133336 RepID=UPI003F5D771B
MKKAHHDLYRTLGYTGPLPSSVPEIPARHVPAPAEDDPGVLAAPGAPPPPVPPPFSGGGGDEPPLDPVGLEILEERLREAPEEVLARARAAWDERLTEDQLREAIAEAMALFRAKSPTAVQMDSPEAHAAAGYALPPEFEFPGMNLDEIPIDPGNTKFETAKDAARWVLFAGPWLVQQTLAKKAPFRWDQQHTSRFVYELPSPTQGSPLEIALVSDFGTGLYASAYIAKQFRTRARPFGYVIHLGDVYYAGRQSEFATNFVPFLNPILGRSRVFTLNANHEMYSLGKPYFDYIDERRRASAIQQQEGSYFCLRSDWCQIIGIDTAYFGHGRHREDALRHWLGRTLREGRQAGRINILLSSDHPYNYGSLDLTALLDQDLRQIVLSEKLVDLWFWGNEHFCALFDRTDALPFIGSCIGHGGYPYTRKKYGAPSPAEVRFLETAGRFPEWTKLRPDRGNNGYCALSLRADRTIELRYIDWMSHERCIAVLAPGGGGERLKIASVEAY